MLRYALTLPLKAVLILTATSAGVLLVTSLALGSLLARMTDDIRRDRM